MRSWLMRRCFRPTIACPRDDSIAGPCNTPLRCVLMNHALITSSSCSTTPHPQGKTQFKMLQALSQSNFEDFRYLQNSMNRLMRNCCQWVFEIIVKLRHLCNQFSTSPTQRNALHFETRQFSLQCVQISLQHGFPFFEKVRLDYRLVKGGMIVLTLLYSDNGGRQQASNLTANRGNFCY